MTDILTIGEHQLPVTVPADVDDQLVAAIGWGLAELPQVLEHSTVTIVGRIASLLVPHDDCTISTMIADADQHIAVRAQLLTLLASPPAPDTAAHPSED